MTPLHQAAAAASLYAGRCLLFGVIVQANARGRTAADFETAFIATDAPRSAKSLPDYDSVWLRNRLPAIESCLAGIGREVPPTVAERLFTLEEALTLLPAVRQLVGEIQAAKQDLDAQTSEVDRLLGLSGGNGHLAADVEGARGAVQAAASKLEGLMAELDSIGVQLKGIDDGLIDFPSEREGRVVNLCWRLGEETIAWWHELDTGFAGRQPL